MTKEQTRNWRVREYIRSSYTSVTYFYKTCSGAKISAEESIKREMCNKEGTRYRVLTGNCFHFTAGYSLKIDGKWHLRYHTAWGYTDYPLTEGEINELYLQ